MDYKKTLNIPFTLFPMKAGLSENSEKFRDFGAQRDIYRKLRKKEHLGKFILHDGPPYANGNIHVGHALNKILKDFILRYKSLRGFEIHYTPGGDTHGLPIENKVEKEHEYKNKNNIEKRKSCHEYALKQIEIQKKQFEQLHLLCDFQEIYRSLDPSFTSKELEILYSFIEQNLLYGDLKPVAWSGSSCTALAESEIIYKEIESKSIYFGFPSSREFKDIPINTRFLIGTTTPYTLEANLALSINPKIKYLLIKNEKNYGIIAKNKYQKLELNGEIIKEFNGEYLEHLNYLNPITKEEKNVILGDHVTEDAGTGIVHTAPGFGLEDYYVCLKYKIPPYSEILDTGHFSNKTKFSPINNSFYTKASEIVIEWLKENGYLFKEQKILHKVGHDGRTEKPLLYRASPQGFINIKKLQPKISKVFKDIKSTPEGLEEKLKNLILSRNEGCLSRQRIGGTPIPILFDNKKPILDLKQIKYTIELLNKHGLDSGFEKEPEFFLHPDTKISGTLEKSKDILDVGFDSGCSGNILKEKQSDLYLEGFDQLRGGFNSSSTISIATQNKLPFKELLAHGFVLDEKGNKMSKSKGNVIDPIEIVNKHGADILRLGLSTNNYLEDIRLSEESLQSSINLYRKIRNTLFRYSLAVIGENFEPEKEILNNLKNPENIYIYQLFKNTHRETIQHLDTHLFFKAIKTNLNFLNIYSGGYLEICKDLLYCSKKNSQEYKEVINLIYEIFHKSLILYSIFIPQTAEEAYGYTNKKYESVMLEKIEIYEEENKKFDTENGNNFFKLKNEIYVQIEDLKNKKEISSSIDTKIYIPKEKIIKSFDLVKLLNVAEVEIIESNEIKVEKSKLNKCERCKRCKILHKNMLCERCNLVIHSFISQN